MNRLSCKYIGIGDFDGSLQQNENGRELLQIGVEENRSEAIQNLVNGKDLLMYLDTKVAKNRTKTGHGHTWNRVLKKLGELGQLPPEITNQYGSLSQVL